MIAGCRHITVRMWATAVVGGLACLWMLPGIQPVVGIDWVVVPAAAILTGVYFLAGTLMNRAGAWQIKRLLQEATVWERAGMGKETEKAYGVAMAAVDGFLLSPRQTRQHADRLLFRLAHYYLSQTGPDNRGQAIVEAYLKSHPEDSQAALRWLQSVSDEEAFVRDHHDLAQNLADAQPGNQPLQRQIARLFLNAARTDYAALSVYRRVLDDPEPDARPLCVALGEILLGQGRCDQWALEVYLAACQVQPERDAWREALAACLDSVRETEQSHSLLQQARQVLAGMEAEQLQILRDDFDRPLTDRRLRGDMEPEPRPVQPPRSHRPKAVALSILGSLTKHAATTLGGCWQGLVSRRRLQRGLKWAALAGLSVGLAVFLASTLSHVRRKHPLTQEKPPVVTAPPVVSDPFTLQVAAYFKQQDAQQFVERLKASGLDAYWTEALSGQKKWYQVRVSHFRDKETAKRYGESLKAKRIIDDYYVANYKPPDAR